MPVFNAEKFIAFTLGSALNQTFKDFELLIMDDGSKDKSRKIIEQYAKKDHRIKLFSQENQGLVKTLNTLVGHAQCDLIARMDADDLAYPDRLEIQYNYLQKHPETVLLGTPCVVFYEEDQSKIRITDTFAEDFLNRYFMNYNCAFMHSAVIFRKEVFKKCQGYLEKEYPAEDYGLWIRMKKHGKVENLRDILNEIRMNTHSVSSKNFRKQIRVRNRLNKENFEDLYQNDEIPAVKEIQKGLRTYLMDAHRKKIFGRMACLTGCFLVEKGETAKSISYFQYAFRLDKSRIDALFNLLFVRFGFAFYCTVDAYIRYITATPQIRFFRNIKKNI